MAIIFSNCDSKKFRIFSKIIVSLFVSLQIMQFLF